MCKPRWEIGVRWGDSCNVLPVDEGLLRGGVHGRVGGVVGRGRLAVSGAGYISIGLGDRMRAFPFAARRSVVGDSGAAGIANGKP